MGVINKRVDDDTGADVAKNSTKASRVFGILGLATAILMVMFEVDNYRRTGQVAYFWLLVAAFMGTLGFYGIIAKPQGK